MFKRIIDRGRAFAETTFSRWVTNSRLPARLDLKEGDETRAFSGVAGIAAGGLLKTASYLGLGFTGFIAFTNPLTAIGAAGYAAATVLFGGTALFGKGMEKGGDNLSGLITFRREMQGAMLGAVREDFRAWRQKRAGKDFAKSATLDVTIKPEKDKQAKPKSNKPECPQC